jgi:hypothetical protein
MSTNAEALLRELQALGVEIVADGERLRWRPRHAVSPAMRELLIQHKEAILAQLTGPTGPAEGGRPTAPMPEPCAGPPSRAPQEDPRPVWVLYPGGYSDIVYTFDQIPPEATYWCRQGDANWQPLPARNAEEEARQCGGTPKPAPRAAEQPKHAQRNLLDPFA